MAPGKESACQCGGRSFSPWGQEDALEEEMATHSKILAWEIPGTEELGMLQSMGSQKSQTQLSNCTTTDTKRRCGHRCAQMDDHVGTQGEDGDSQAKKGHFRQTSAADASIIPPATRAVKK